MTTQITRSRSWTRALLLTAGLGIITSGAAAGLMASDTSALSVVKISPVRRDVEITPGKTGRVSLRITNVTNQELTVRPVQNDFVAGDETGAPALILDSGDFAEAHSLKRFMKPLPTLKLPPREHKDITVVINVPGDAEAGGYYGAIRFVPVSDGRDSTVSVNASAASLLLLTVPGDVVSKLELESFQVMHSDKRISIFSTGGGDLQAEVKFKNSGNIHEAPFGQIYVKRGDEVVDSVDFNHSLPRSNVLPGSSRLWTESLKDIRQFGKYTVGAVFTYGGDNQSIEVEQTFWMIPKFYLIGAGGLVAIVSLSFVISMPGRRRRRRLPYRRDR